MTTSRLSVARRPQQQLDDGRLEWSAGLCGPTSNGGAHPDRQTQTDRHPHLSWLRRGRQVLVGRDMFDSQVQPSAAPAPAAEGLSPSREDRRSVSAFTDDGLREDTKLAGCRPI
mmetsp:Transcript_1827/g.3973  ORF Transcript_1827/g.3973 Transcript_1827/m.3973 type:complete len:114 (-) Transcript_1827:237-578(-)